MKKKIILVPDIHGRDFWKEILPFVDECVKIIFLGDYHDPYPDEGITPSQSLSNFNEILAFAKQHQDKVTMLLETMTCHITTPMKYRIGMCLPTGMIGKPTLKWHRCSGLTLICST